MRLTVSVYIPNKNIPKLQGKRNLTCKSENVIYLLQCRICQLQYVGKSETPFNVRRNNHRKDAKSQASILACEHFNEQNHNFQQHAEFTLSKLKNKQPLKKPAPPSKPSPQDNPDCNNQMKTKNLQTASILNGGQQINQIKTFSNLFKKLCKYCQFTKNNFKGSSI